MVTESVVVLLLVVILAYLYVRRGKRGIAMAMLPLAVLPLMNVLGALLSTTLGATVLLTPPQWQTLFTVAGLLVGGSLFGIISSNIKKKSARRMYLLVCGGFTVLFAFAMLVDRLAIF